MVADLSTVITKLPPPRSNSSHTVSLRDLQPALQNKTMCS